MFSKSVMIFLFALLKAQTKRVGRVTKSHRSGTGINNLGLVGTPYQRGIEDCLFAV